MVTNFKKVITYEEKSVDKDQRKAFDLQQTANKIIKEYGEMMEDHQKAVQGLKKEAIKKQNVVAKIQESTQTKLNQSKRFLAQEQLRRMMSESSEEELSDEDEHENTITMSKDQVLNIMKS